MSVNEKSYKTMQVHIQRIFAMALTEDEVNLMYLIIKTATSL